MRSQPHTFTKRLTKVPSKRTPRLGRVIFVVTIVACGLIALGYRSTRDARERSPLLLLAQEIAQRVGVDGEVRTALTDAGAHLTNFDVLAIGGCRAEIVPAPGEEATGIIGNLYIANSGATYALEFSAERTEEGFTLTRVWKATRINIAPNNHTRSVVDDLFRDSATDLGGAQIRSPKLFFYEI